jgi:hypothetical protein
VSDREFSEKDFKSGKGRGSGLKKLKNSLKELSSSIEKGRISEVPVSESSMKFSKSKAMTNLNQRMGEHQFASQLTKQETKRHVF